MKFDMDPIDQMASEAARIIRYKNQVIRLQRGLLIISACVIAVLVALLIA